MLIAEKSIRHSENESLGAGRAAAITLVLLVLDWSERRVRAAKREVAAARIEPSKRDLARLFVDYRYRGCRGEPGRDPRAVGLTRFRGQVDYAACFTRSVLSCSAGLM